MPRACSVCIHINRESIDDALRVGDTSLRTIARRWFVSKSALIRHKNAHLRMSIGTPAATEAIPEDTPSFVPDPTLRHLTLEDSQRELRRQLASMIRQ